MATAHNMQYIQYFSNALRSAQKSPQIKNPSSPRPVRQQSNNLLKPPQSSEGSLRVADPKRASELYAAQEQRSRMRPAASQTKAQARSSVAPRVSYGPHGRFYSDAERAAMDEEREKADRLRSHAAGKAEAPVDQRVENLNRKIAQEKRSSPKIRTAAPRAQLKDDWRRKDKDATDSPLRTRQATPLKTYNRITVKEQVSRIAMTKTMKITWKCIPVFR